MKWEVTLKNSSSYRCLVKIAYQLLSQDNQVLYNDDLPIQEIFESQETKKVHEGGSSESIETKSLSLVHSSRVVILSVQ